MIPTGKPRLPEIDDIALPLKEMLDSKQITNGKNVRELEESVKKMCKVDNAIAFSSATNALFLLIKALDWKGKIAIPDYTWISTKIAAQWNGLQVEYIDVDPETWLASDIPACSNFALLVDTFGNRCDLNPDVPTIYDAAHSFGVKGVGNRGVAEIFSFAPMKTVTGCEGGMVVTNDNKLAIKLREYAKFFSRMPEFNAIVAKYNLLHYKRMHKEKELTFQYYERQLGVSFKFQKINSESNYTEVSIIPRSGDRDNILARLYDQMEYRIRYEPSSNLPNTNYLWKNSFIIPSWIGVPREEVVRLINAAIEN